MNFHRICAVPLAAALMFVTVASVACQAPRDTLDVLFVGNSYVYFNNLPGMVEAVSRGVEGPVVRGTGHTHGGMPLRGHLGDGHLPEIFSQGPAAGGEWDFVVLQEQSTLGTSYDSDSGTLGTPEAFHGAAREVVAMIEAFGADPMFYMTWAKKSFPQQSGPLSQAYRAIGAELGVPVAPVGEAWAEVRRLRPDFDLFVSDGSHPNAAGSYLAACVIYASVTGGSPVGAPRELMGVPWDFSGPITSAQQSTILVSLSPSDAEFLQSIAWKAVSAGAGSGR